MKRGISKEKVKELLTIGIKTKSRLEYDSVAKALGIRSADEMLEEGKKYGIRP